MFSLLLGKQLGVELLELRINVHLTFKTLPSCLREREEMEGKGEERREKGRRSWEEEEEERAEPADIELPPANGRIMVGESSQIV